MDFLSGLLAKFMVGKAVNFIAGEAGNLNQPVDMPKNVEEYGFSQSLKNRGSATAYKMNIYHLYETFKSDVGRDEKRQDELRRPLKRVGMNWPRPYSICARKPMTLPVGPETVSAKKSQLSDRRSPV